MRYLIVFLMAVLIAGTAALYYRQQMAARNAQLVMAEQAAERERQVQEMEREKERTLEQQKNLLRLTEQMGKQIQAQNQTITNMAAASQAEAETNSQKSAGAFGKMVASMMQDPEAKRFIREQQKTMVDQLYAPLVKQLNLTPDQAEQFKALLLDNMMRGAEKGTALFAGTSAGERAEAVKTLAADQQAFEEQLRGFLGEEGYAQYKEYSMTLQERTQLNMFRQQMTGNENQITDQQAEQLLALMREEKQNMGTAIPEALKGGGQNPAAMQAVFDEEQASRLLEAQEAINARVQERAGQVLSPDQLASFARFQTNQMSMMRMGLTMARKMFSGEGSDSSSVPAVAPQQ
jgi:hypothetical protein